MEAFSRRSSRPKARQSLAHIPSLSAANNVDKQNATIDLAAAQKARESASLVTRKRTRGKSLGPGGLEALKETDGNAVKIASSIQPKSILKPTVPLTPPKNIPTFDELRQRSTRKRSPGKIGTEALLIDFSTPGPNSYELGSTSASDSQNVLDPFSPLKTAVQSDDRVQSMQEADEKEERLRQEQKKAILELRAARRKSMANRRVSFAPEATLHTWSVMEMMEDSTTSSASNSTRRQSAITNEQTPQRDTLVSQHASEAPKDLSGPSGEADAPVAQSIAGQGARLDKSRRRNSEMSEDMDISGDEVYSSSPSGDIAAESSPIRVEDSINSDSDTEGDTAMSMDEMTQDTVQSHISESSTRSSLDERLRQAANQAGTRGIEYDEYGEDVSMEIADDTVTNAFQPWTRGQLQLHGNLEDQENAAQSPTTRMSQVEDATEIQNDDATEDVAMETTKAIGRIVENGIAAPKSRRKSVMSKRRSSVGRRQSTGADSSYGDDSMDMTTIAGGIIQTYHEGSDTAVGDEEVTMDFTTAVGGLQSRQRRESMQSTTSEGNEFMDMTAVVGGILYPIEEQTETQQIQKVDKTTSMDLMRAVDQARSDEAKNFEATSLMQDMAISSTDVDIHLNRPKPSEVKDIVANTPKQLTSVASETGSPSLAMKSRSSGRTRPSRTSQTSTPRCSMRNSPQQMLSNKEQVTPTKQLTPVPTRGKTPERTPASTSVTRPGASPKKLFQAEIEAKASPACAPKSATKQSDPLFAQDELTGRQTPRVILHASKPHQHFQRRSSGIGIDKEGFGSPSVTQLLARRSSIGDEAPPFKLESRQSPRLRFVDPKQLSREVDTERTEDARRESGRFIMKQEANAQQDENVTLQLKDMIESMTPKKNRLNRTKGRKSLAIGSAKGLLGKRPMELDKDDEDEGDTTPKRLKAVSREGSPVKQIHLPKPPSKEETTGRLARAEQFSMDTTAQNNLTPTHDKASDKHNTASSPQHFGHYRDILQHASVERPTSFEDKLDNVVGAIDPSIEHAGTDKIVAEEDKISLQQFLNMTNIHFIELNTTKRRHTIVPSSSNESVGNEPGVYNPTKSCFKTAATTIPLLELYQHATRELKSYISTGRKIIRSIENETLSEQPALFREYVEARPDVKLVMDNQFRNGKTNARLQSKEGWYTWRAQLVDGLQSGLESIQNDIKKDLAVIEEQTQILAQVVPSLTEHRQGLSQEVEVLHQKLGELNSIDRRELIETRKDLQLTSNELEERLATLETVRRQMDDKNEVLLQAAELKDEMQQQITEADRVCEEYRGWAVKDVLGLKAKVDELQKQSGWSLISAEEDTGETNGFGAALTMSYENALRLFFYPSAFGRGSMGCRRSSAHASKAMSTSAAPISLTLLPPQGTDEPTPSLMTEQRFFLQLIQSQLHALAMLPRCSVATKTVLNTASCGWGLACKVTEEVRLLNLMGTTRVSIEGDEKLTIKLMLIVDKLSRVDIQFNLVVMVRDDGEMSISQSSEASAVYGPITGFLDAARVRKVKAALDKELENKALGDGAWINAVLGFEQWHRSQHQKRAESQTRKIEAALVREQPMPGSTTPNSPAPHSSKTEAIKRSPLATKKSSVIQRKTIPVATSRQDKLRTSQREQQPLLPPEKPQVTAPEPIQDKDKENSNPFVYGSGHKAPAITPEMQEAMMQRTPIKRVGALRRSPI